MNKEQWLKSRNKHITGSDASAILGLNPYKSNIDVWEEKTGRKQSEDISHKDFVKYGIEAERHLTELFKLDYPQYEVITNEYDLKIHPEYDFLAGTLDGELVEKETGRKGVFEIKTTNILQSMQKEKWENQVPQNYFIQVLHYLLITNYEFVVLKAQLKSVWKDEIRLTTKHYFMERKDHELDLEFLLQKEKEFWEYVKFDKCPPLLLPSI